MPGHYDKTGSKKPEKSKGKKNSASSMKKGYKTKNG
tara:strand:- start:6784 stop:6891 length:108 start_codon:yes stop_codon:yes gene_type:complete